MEPARFLRELLEQVEEAVEWGPGTEGLVLTPRQAARPWCLHCVVPARVMPQADRVDPSQHTTWLSWPQ